MKKVNQKKLISDRPSALDHRFDPFKRFPFPTQT
jgi:hypothetical protein